MYCEDETRSAADETQGQAHTLAQAAPFPSTGTVTAHSLEGDASLQPISPGHPSPSPGS